MSFTCLRRTCRGIACDRRSNLKPGHNVHLSYSYIFIIILSAQSFAAVAVSPIDPGVSGDVEWWTTTAITKRWIENRLANRCILLIGESNVKSTARRTRWDLTFATFARPTLYVNIIANTCRNTRCFRSCVKVPPPREERGTRNEQRAIEILISEALVNPVRSDRGNGGASSGRKLGTRLNISAQLVTALPTRESGSKLNQPLEQRNRK